MSDRQTLRRLLVNGGHYLGAALAGLLTYPIVARVLDAEGLGVWALLGAGAFLLNLADLGLTLAVQRAAVAGELERARRLIALTLSVLCVTLPTIGLVAYFFLLDLDRMPAELERDAARAAIVALVAGGASAMVGPYRGFAFARGGVRMVANARLCASVTQVAITVAGFAIVQSLLAPAFGLLCGYLVQLLLTTRAARRIDPRVPRWPAWPREKGEVRTAFRNGAAQLFINLAVTTALRVDLFVLVRVAPLAVVAAYGVAGRAVDMAYLLTKQSTVALLPELGHARQRDRAARIGTGAFTALVVSGMAAAALCGQPLLEAWVGPVAGGPVASSVLVLLGLAAMLMSTYEVVSVMVMLGAKSGWSCALPVVIGSSINLMLSIAGAPHFGVWAVAGSTVVGNAVSMVLMWNAALRLLGWRAPALTTALAPAAASAIAACTTGALLSHVAQHGIVASLACCVSVALVGCGAGALAIRVGGGRLASRAGGETVLRRAASSPSRHM